MSRVGPLSISPSVADALSQSRPVVALESSVICQGLPRPQNLEAARAAESAVRGSGSVPATLAVVDGQILVGLDESILEELADSDGVEKAGSRDLARAVAAKQTMATTVGASLAIARAAGIHVLATGGIGGVHRHAETTGDISNDLFELSTVPAITICSGIKSVLDLPKTLEYLETLGVAVVGYRTRSLPNFYGVDSGFCVPEVPDAHTIAEMLATGRELGVTAGIVVANPPPEQYAFQPDELDRLVSKAVASAGSDGIAGKDVTPYLLDHIARESRGRSVDLNVALLESNARLAGEVAVAVAGR